MCLKTLTHTYVRPNNEEVYAYKVFDHGYDGYYFEYQALNDTLIVPLDKWLTAQRVNIGTVCPNSKIYATGFHCIANREDAVRYAERGQKIIRVKIRQIECVGTQSGYHHQGTFKVLVAREMFVPQPQPKKSRKKR